MKLRISILLLLTCFPLLAQEATREIRIKKTFLNLPVQSSEERQVMSVMVDGEKDRQFDIRLSRDQTDYWVFMDVSPFRGKTLTLTYPENIKGLADIYQYDEMAGADSLYRETKRPQLHFTSRRGWNNDPNGLVYYDGEYHLYYQHNPYGILWGNMHWGHAVSKDLLHWEELPYALYPDEHGTMFSGSAAVDWNNTSGWQKGKEKTIIAAYSASGPKKQVQCIAYSNDRGRTFTKYEGNPVIDSKDEWNSRHTRDPKIIWHEELGKWVIILFEEYGHSIYHSDDAKTWEFVSHYGGFWECPELFALPVDGDRQNVKWVTYGASGTYQIGDFDGYTFTPETDKLNYFSGRMYAAQTYTDIPESDGRRIQFGWGQINQLEMPFNQMMTFPTELTLRSTNNGVRLFSEPIWEIEKLHVKSHQWDQLSMEDANEMLKTVEGDLLHIKTTVEQVQHLDFRFKKDGASLVHYQFNHNLLNDVFFAGEMIADMTISLELIIDRTSVEIFADGGRFSLIEQLANAENNNGLEFATGGELIIHTLEVHELKSIWE